MHQKLIKLLKCKDNTFILKFLVLCYPYARTANEWIPIHSLPFVLTCTRSVLPQTCSHCLCSSNLFCSIVLNQLNFLSSIFFSLFFSWYFPFIFSVIFTIDLLNEAMKWRAFQSAMLCSFYCYTYCFCKLYAKRSGSPLYSDYFASTFLWSLLISALYLFHLISSILFFFDSDCSFI